MTTSKLPSLIGMRSISKGRHTLLLVVDYFHLAGLLFWHSCSNAYLVANITLPVQTIVGVAVVVVATGAVVESSSVVKLSFVVTRYLHWSWAYAFHQDKASSIKVPLANVTLFSSAYLLRENTDSVRSN
ncbi:hypothetical protein Tco_0821447 [Tanacetum coccineum]|uniref:Uncharacterized protein n=1 Tax=Tanacetum coccineum TaxID=301880 RepID=A0ABQ5AD97_9ASTR